MSGTPSTGDGKSKSAQEKLFYALFVGEEKLNDEELDLKRRLQDAVRNLTPEQKREIVRGYSAEEQKAMRGHAVLGFLFTDIDESDGKATAA